MRHDSLRTQRVLATPCQRADVKVLGTALVAVRPLRCRESAGAVTATRGVLDSLASHGASPVDVTDVIFTHLHVALVAPGRGRPYLEPVTDRLDAWDGDNTLLPGLDVLSPRVTPHHGLALPGARVRACTARRWPAPVGPSDAMSARRTRRVARSSAGRAMID